MGRAGVQVDTDTDRKDQNTFRQHSEAQDVKGAPAPVRYAGFHESPSPQNGGGCAGQQQCPESRPPVGGGRQGSPDACCQTGQNQGGARASIARRSRAGTRPLGRAFFFLHPRAGRNQTREMAVPVTRRSSRRFLGDW
ncbi:MAG: hypothetical protein HFI30_12515 [Lachnospiraceae bacterium]|nr:hypothetical protein [Lachnospiraceae bacterium]